MIDDNHLNEQLSRKIVYKTLGEDWKRFLSHREQNDPGERFLSKYFRDLIE